MDSIRILGINWDQFNSLTRDALKLIGAYLVMRGLTDESTWLAVSGSMMTLGGIAVSLYVHSVNAKLARVAAMPELQGAGKGIVTTPQIAAAIGAPNVVAHPSSLT